jgi:hypothetical protein
MSQLIDTFIGAFGGFCAAALLFEILLPALAALYARRRRALGLHPVGEVEERKRVTVRYVCQEPGCFGECKPVGEPLSTSGWHEHRCTKCHTQYALRRRYPFTSLIRP